MDSYEKDEDKERSQQQKQERINFQFDEIMNFLLNNSDMKQTTKSSMKQGIMAGGGAVVGGILLGPVGGLMGGIAGSVTGYIQSKEQYDGIIQQLQTRIGDDPKHKERLVEMAGSVLREAGANVRSFDDITAYRDTLTQYATSRNVRDNLWKICLDTISNKD